jgi:hypothetical protein
MEYFEDFQPVDLETGSTSYFSKPEAVLDPSLFSGSHLLPSVRDWIMETVCGFLAEKYFDPEGWSKIWVAGSGVSYQWSADRDPADLDVMLGIDYVKFRSANPRSNALSDSEISSMINEEMHSELYPEISRTHIGNSTFEVTVYVNMGVSADPEGIRAINPYAAYDVSDDEWTVPPNPKPMVRVHPSWDVTVETDKDRASEILRVYGDLLTQIQNATNPAHRANAERQFQAVVEAGSSLFDEIHGGRRGAFSPMGRGYSDFANYRWQSGKRSGVVQSMRKLKDYQNADRERKDFETYGIRIPRTDTIIRRASTYRQPY